MGIINMKKKSAFVPKRKETWSSPILCGTALMILPLTIAGIGDFRRVGVTFWIVTPKVNKISTWNFNMKLLDS